MDLVVLIFGILANIFAGLLFLSPLDIFWKIVKGRSTQEFESIPYIVLLLCASIWTYYGAITSQLLLVTINGFGTVMGIIYVIIFLIFAPPRMKARSAVLAVVVNVVFLVGVIVATRLTLSWQTHVNIIGTLSVCITVLTFAAPASAIKTVLVLKTVEFVDIWLIVFSFLMGTMWTVYASLVHDNFVLIPNCIGASIAFILLLLYAWYKIPWFSNRTQRHSDGALEQGGQHEHLISASG